MIYKAQARSPTGLVTWKQPLRSNPAGGAEGRGAGQAERRAAAPTGNVPAALRLPGSGLAAWASAGL